MEKYRGEWIPCSRRLPSCDDLKDIGVIATVEGREGNVVYTHGVVSDAWYEDGKWYVNGVLLETAKVTARMPFPEGYKESEEQC